MSVVSNNDLNSQYRSQYFWLKNLFDVVDKLGLKAIGGKSDTLYIHFPVGYNAENAILQIWESSKPDEMGWIEHNKSGYYLTRGNRNILRLWWD